MNVLTDPKKRLDFHFKTTLKTFVIKGHRRDEGGGGLEMIGFGDDSGQKGDYVISFSKFQTFSTLLIFFVLFYS